MYLVLDLGHLYHLERSVSSRKAADHPATFTKIKVPPQMFLCFIIRQMVPNCDFLHFQKTLSLDFLEMNFSQNCFGHYSVKFHAREKIYLLSCGLKSHWPIRLHDFSEYSFSLTFWVFGMNITDIPRIWELYSCTVNRKGNFIISNSVSYTWSSWYLNWLLYFID